MVKYLHMPNAECVKKRNAEDGFTLIELIVVISLISIMFFFTMPRFQEAIGLNESQKVSGWIMVKTQTLKENAVRNQKLHTLHIGLDSGTMWTSSGDVTEEALEEGELKGYKIPEDIRITAVEYPVKGNVSMGRADICFYKQGYSDKVLIHIEDDDNNQRSLLIEPFLSKIKIYEEHVGFEE
ncbi:type II secretion system protein [Desulfonema magnum]|uniref:Prepilin-type cleavage/methylation N-terminal domain-containing protein n=1 Tax=Desulfonema magnum TaxID=45655 RepID=A0A975GTQ4_9BACT|nr:type II secretion system protein [Desulfonema magnum]QTA93222.1 Prepilin-type cleavage/methylation N-terminal domain-containing protein [Desulfonema magnum]